MKQKLASLIPVDLATPGDCFLSCPKTLKWIRDAFLNQDSELYNVEHDHLNSAEIGFLWTNVPNSRQMKSVVGTAEIGRPPTSLANKWAKARYAMQMRAWFGSDELDFIITLYAPYFAGASELEQCAIIEHELYHCGQVYDEYQCPRARSSAEYFYVGSTGRSPTHRFSQHLTQIRTGRHLNPGLVKRALEIGLENLAVDVLEDTNSLNRFEKENFWLTKLRAAGHPLTNIKPIPVTKRFTPREYHQILIASKPSEDVYEMFRLAGIAGFKLLIDAGYGDGVPGHA